MDIDRVRRICIRALASDAVLMERLVLKGGNALTLVHKLSGRTSLDLDYSIEGDFDDSSHLESHLMDALHDAFVDSDLVPFGAKFESRPRAADVDAIRFGGYRLEFMLAPAHVFRKHADDFQRLARSAILSGPGQQRKYRIEISRFEYCGWTEQIELDGTLVRVYAFEMIVAEKLRALCQQLPYYPHRSNKTPRPRDFYDIYVCVVRGGVTVSSRDFSEVLFAVFAAKEVPVTYLEQLHEYRDYHATGWADVEVSVADELNDFDFYFDFVLAEIGRLQAFWDKYSPG